MNTNIVSGFYPYQLAVIPKRRLLSHYRPLKLLLRKTTDQRLFKTSKIIEIHPIAAENELFKVYKAFWRHSDHFLPRLKKNTAIYITIYFKYRYKSKIPWPLQAHECMSSNNYIFVSNHSLKFKLSALDSSVSLLSSNMWFCMDIFNTERASQLPWVGTKNARSRFSIARKWLLWCCWYS